jgi:hypothetical protein
MQFAAITGLEKTTRVSLAARRPGVVHPEKVRVQAEKTLSLYGVPCSKFKL